MQSVRDLVDSALDGEIYFDEFAEKAQKLGVISIALDMIAGHHTFYTADGKVFDHALKTKVFEVSDNFHEGQVTAAIAKFDSREITGSQFHKALSAAGVSYSRCYFKSKRAFYFSAAGEFHLEKW